MDKLLVFGVFALVFFGLMAIAGAVTQFLLPPACAAFGLEVNPTYWQSLALTMLAGIVGWGSRSSGRDE